MDQGKMHHIVISALYHEIYNHLQCDVKKIGSYIKYSHLDTAHSASALGTTITVGLPEGYSVVQPGGAPYLYAAYWLQIARTAFVLARKCN